MFIPFGCYDYASETPLTLRRERIHIDNFTGWSFSGEARVQTYKGVVLGVNSIFSTRIGSWLDRKFAKPLLRLLRWREHWVFPCRVFRRILIAVANPRGTTKLASILRLVRASYYPSLRDRPLRPWTRHTT